MQISEIEVGQAVNVRTDLWGSRINHRVESVSAVNRDYIYTQRGAHKYSRRTGAACGPGVALFGLQTYIELYQPETTD